MKRYLAAALLLTLLLGGCGGETPGGQPIALEDLALECKAPLWSGADFPATAMAFGESLRLCLVEQNVTAERLDVSFSRVDAATADALERGGVELAVLGSGGALVEDGTVLLGLSRSGEGASRGQLCTGESAYGKQLATRAGGAELTEEELRRAAIGAVESDERLCTAFAWTLAQRWKLSKELLLYETEEALRSAAAAGELDLMLLRTAEEETVVAETEPFFEGLVVLSPQQKALQSGAAKEALTEALQAAAQTDAGKALLGRYGARAFTPVTEDEIKAMRSFAIWEEMQ